MRLHRHSSKKISKKDTHSQNNINSQHSPTGTHHHQRHHSKSNRTTATSSSSHKSKKRNKLKERPTEANQKGLPEASVATTDKPTDRRQLSLAIQVERPSDAASQPPPQPPHTSDGNSHCNKDVVVVVEPPTYLPAPPSFTSTKSSPGRRPSLESKPTSRSASTTSLASSTSSRASASSSSSSSFCRHCLRPQRELQLRYVRHRRHKKPESTQPELPTTHSPQHQLAIAQPSALADTTKGRRSSRRSTAAVTSSKSATTVKPQRTTHRMLGGSGSMTNTSMAAGRQRLLHRHSQPTTTTTIRIESEGGSGSCNLSRNQNFNQNLSVTTPNLLTVSGASSNRSSRSGGRASSSRSAQLDQQTPESPSLVKVRTWYTVAKQGVSC